MPPHLPSDGADQASARAPHVRGVRTASTLARWLWLHTIKAALPRFAHAGILDQVVDRAYDGRRIVDDDFARAIGSDLFWQDKARSEQRHYATYVAWIDIVIGRKNREDLEADDAERWRDHTSLCRWCIASTI